MLPYGVRRVDGTMIPRWADLRIVPGALTKGGAADPFLDTWQPGGSGVAYAVYTFNNADELFFTAQVPHSYVLGTDLQAHIHWTPRDRGVTEDTKTVAWKIDVSAANKFGVAPSSTTLDLTDTCDGVNDKHLRTDDVELDGAGLTEMSAIIIGRVYRDAGDTWAGNIAAQAPAILEVDFHYQLDDVGSLLIDVKR
jgi:hypothetical protein